MAERKKPRAPAPEPHVLKSGLGEFFAYRDPEYGMRFTASAHLARVYKTHRGAAIARAAYRRSDLRKLTVEPFGA